MLDGIHPSGEMHMAESAMMTSASASSVYVGKKPIAIYLAKVITLLADGKEVLIVARGRFILKAILVAVRAMKATNCDCKVAIGEEILSMDGKRPVPRIEIRLAKAG